MTKKDNLVSTSIMNFTQTKAVCVLLLCIVILSSSLSCRRWHLVVVLVISSSFIVVVSIISSPSHRHLHHIISSSSCHCRLHYLVVVVLSSSCHYRLRHSLSERDTHVSLSGKGWSTTTRNQLTLVLSFMRACSSYALPFPEASIPMISMVVPLG